MSVLYSVLNKLLYFDIRELSECAFLLSQGELLGPRGHGWVKTKLCLFSRKLLECPFPGLLC